MRACGGLANTRKSPAHGSRSPGSVLLFALAPAASESTAVPRKAERRATDVRVAVHSGLQLAVLAAENKYFQDRDFFFEGYSYYTFSLFFESAFNCEFVVRSLNMFY